MNINVVIADDQQLVRSGFRMILDSEPDITVVAEAADGTEAVELAKLHRPDVVVMDVRMPRLDGLEATKAITEAGIGTHVLVVTTFDLDEYVYAALNNGASGFLLKDAPPEDLVTAVRVVHSGDALLAPRVTRLLIEQYLQKAPAPAKTPAIVNDLTERELEVLMCLAAGRSNAEIATVKTHIGHILMKLGLRDRVQAVVFAYQHGLIVTGE